MNKVKFFLVILLQACGFPLYWKGILFSAAGGDKTGLLSYVGFSDFWRKMCATHHDEAAQFMHILTFKNQRKNLLSPEDFVPLVQDVVDTHPGLGFLKEATEFHSRYVHTVSQFYIINMCPFNSYNSVHIHESKIIFEKYLSCRQIQYLHKGTSDFRNYFLLSYARPTKRNIYDNDLFTLFQLVS